jgi:transcriptional regulator with XRE-family HTH domain
MVSDRRAFGERLKRQRERTGVSLESIAKSTKISGSLFAALERGDCSRWPAGIYGRAYVKAYAEAIGLNASDVVDEFGTVFGAPGAHSPVEDGGRKGPRRPPLRLVLADDPSIRLDVVARRAALAAADLIVGSLIASLVFVGLHGGVWSTVGGVLAYYVIGRAISDDPLLYWAVGRMRSAQARRSSQPPQEQEKVAVGDAASTAA